MLLLWWGCWCAPQAPAVGMLVYVHPELQQWGCCCASQAPSMGMLACSLWPCTPWGDKVWRHSWSSHEAADCSARPQRLPSLFLCLALPNYVSECFYFDANHL